MHPTYRSLNKTPLIMGGERRMMIAAMTLGPALGMHTGSWVVGVCVALLITGAAHLQVHDPVLLRAIFRRHHKRYCPGVRKPFVIRERL